MRQPTVTSALQKLEETLGCQLIQRDSRHFVLTSQGEALREECIEITRCIERIGTELSFEKNELTGLIKILLVTHIPVPALDHAMRQMRNTYPLVTIQIDVANSQDVIRNVAQKYTPFGFCLMQKPISTLDCQFLYREHYGIYCGASHPLYGHTNIDIKELKKEAFIAFGCSQQGNALEPMISLHHGAGLGAWTVGSSPNLEEVHRMIAAGIGIGTLPCEVVHYDVMGGRLWLLSTLNGALGADVYFIQNPEMKLSPAEKAFLDIYKTALYDLTGETDETLDKLSLI